MDDDKDIRQLFADFKPELPSGERFQSALNAKLDAVEFIQQRQASLRKQRRTSLCAAALAGLIVGVLLGGIMPSFINWLTGQFLFTSELATVGVQVAAWAVAGGVSVIFAAYIYSRAMAYASKGI